MAARSLLVLALGLAALVGAFFFLQRKNAGGPAPGQESYTPGAGAEDRAALLEAPARDGAPEASAAQQGVAPDSADATSPAVPAVPGEAHAVQAPVLCVVHGRVTDAGGQPIPGWDPYVSLSDATGLRLGTGEVGEDGRYSIAGATPGSWTLACGAVLYRGTSVTVELTPEQPVVRRDLVLERAVVLPIQVLSPDGRPFWQAAREVGHDSMLDLLPVATVEPPGSSMPGADGLHNDHVGVGNFWDYGPPRAGLGPTYIGVVVLDGELPVYVSLLLGTHVLETQRIEQGTKEVTFVLPVEALARSRSTLKLRALDGSTGQPLLGTVTVAGQTGSGPQGKLEPDGSWSSTQEPGEYEVSVYCAGFESLPRRVRLGPGQELDLGELALEPELVIEARVLDPEGNPVAGQEFLLGWTDPELGRLRFQELRLYASDREGKLGVGGLRRDRYVLRTTGEDEFSSLGDEDEPTTLVSGCIEVSTLGGPVSGLEIRLARAGELVLRGTEGLPERAYYRLWDGAGHVLRSSYFYEGFLPRALVPPGQYELVLHGAEGEELLRRTVEVGAGTTEVDVAF